MIKQAIEAYQAAYDKYTRDRTNFLEWIATNTQIKAEAKQNFTSNDYIPSNSTTRRTLRSPSSQISINQASIRNLGRTSFCGRQRALSRLHGFPFSLNLDKSKGLVMDVKLAKIYYSPQGFRCRKSPRRNRQTVARNQLSQLKKNLAPKLQSIPDRLV